MTVANAESNACASATIARSQLQHLVDLLRDQGHQVIAPTVMDGTIAYREVSAIDELPVGWTDKQDGGSYRLARRDDTALFGYSVGADSWKKFLHPERIRLWRAERNGGEVRLIDDVDIVPKYAFLGVRSCELHAIAIQDKVFMANEQRDDDYLMRRENTFIIAVNCGQAAATCFCVSMNTGPRVTSGFDIALTEIIDDGSQRYLAEAGSAHGARLLSQVTGTDPSSEDHAAAARATANASEQMGRSMDTTGIKELLQENQDNPHWDDVAARCLTCANCTMVCPTCFCTTVQDVTDLNDEHAERWRSWHSCFTLDFSYIHGGSVRQSAKSRYRQWLTHKLAHWIDQFDSSGCVGCGRCITWCPVGIDITAEVAAIRTSVTRDTQ